MLLDTLHTGGFVSVHSERNGEVEEIIIVKDENGDALKVHSIQLLKSQVKDIGFSSRVVNALNRGKIFFVWQLVSLTKKQIYMIDSIGDTAMEEIEQTLHDYGLRFNSTAPDYSWATTNLGVIFLRVADIAWKSSDGKPPTFEKLCDLINFTVKYRTDNYWRGW